MGKIHRSRWIDGRCAHPDYGRWAAMTKNHEVCAEWVRNPWAFYDHLATLGPKPEGHYALARVDATQPYRPGNIQWVRHRDLQKMTR